MSDEVCRARVIAENGLIEEIYVRYPSLRVWVAEQCRGSGLTYVLVIVRPQNVRDDYHRVVHDHELRERARGIIHLARVNEPGDNAVLILAPEQ